MGLFSGLKIRRWTAKGDAAALLDHFKIIADQRKKQSDAERKQMGAVIEGLAQIDGPEAAAALGEIGVFRSLHVRANTRRAAVKALAGLAPADAVPALESLLNSVRSEKAIFDLAAEILITKMKQPGVRAVKKAFQTLKPALGERIIDVIAGLNSPRCAKILIPVLGSESIALRLKALAVLNDHPNAVAVEQVLPLLEDGSGDVITRTHALLDKKGWKPQGREAVIKRALSVGDPKPLIEIGREDLPALIELLEDPKGRGKNTLLKALGKIGDPRAIEAIAARLDRYHAKNAIAALNRIDDPSAGPALVDYYKQAIKQRYHSGVTVPILDVLIRHGWEPEFLIEMLSRGGKETRRKCARALVALYQSGDLPQSVKDKILAQQEAITARHSDKTSQKHSDNGVRPKTRTLDCSHSDSTYPHHVDQGVGVKFPLV